MVRANPRLRVEHQFNLQIKGIRVAFTSRHDSPLKLGRRLRQAYKDNGSSNEPMRPDDDIGATTTYVRATLLGVNGLPSIAQESIVGGAEGKSEPKSVTRSRFVDIYIDESYALQKRYSYSYHRWYVQSQLARDLTVQTNPWENPHQAVIRRQHRMSQLVDQPDRQ
jgi:hypothetical protein